MSDNVRRPSGLGINGIPSADDIIAMARDNVFLAGAIGQWRHGTINFDEALRLAIRLLLEQNEALNRLSQAMAASAWPGPIIIEHPVRGSDEPLKVLSIDKQFRASDYEGATQIPHREYQNGFQLGRQCPVCACEIEMGQPPNFKAEESGESHDGERTVHWARGTQTCPECGATWPYEDSD